MPRGGDDGGVPKQPPALSSLDDRIQSGEFTEGSTKEQITRPVRKILAQDPVGIGAFWRGECGGFGGCVGAAARRATC